MSGASKGGVFMECAICGRVVAAKFGYQEEPTRHYRLIGYDEDGIPEHAEQEEGGCPGSLEPGLILSPKDYEVWQSPHDTLEWRRLQ